MLWSGTQFSGGDMPNGGSNEAGLLQCQIKCLSTYGCLFYQWNPSGAHNCHLKNSLPTCIMTTTNQANYTTGAAACKILLKNG